MLPRHHFKSFKRLFSRFDRLVFERVGKRKHRLRACDDGSFYNMFQLPHITWPVVRLKTLHHFFRNGFKSLPCLLGVLADKMPGKLRNILGSHPQGRYCDGEHVQPVKKVLPEPSISDLSLEVSTCRGDYPYVHFYCPGAAKPFEFTILQYPQELCLEFNRNLTDFVQKERPAVGNLETADLPVVSPREGTLLPPE